MALPSAPADPAGRPSLCSEVSARRPRRCSGEGLQQDPPPKWRHVRPVRLQLGPDCFPEALDPPTPTPLCGWGAHSTVSAADLRWHLFLAQQLKNAHANAASISGARLPAAAADVLGFHVRVQSRQRSAQTNQRRLRHLQVASQLLAGFQEGEFCSHLSRKSASLQRRTAFILRAGLLRKGVVKATRTGCPCPPQAPSTISSMQRQDPSPPWRRKKAPG